MENIPSFIGSNERPVEESLSVREVNKLIKEIYERIKQLKMQIHDLQVKSATDNADEITMLNTQIYSLERELNYLYPLKVSHLVAKEFKNDSFDRVSELTDPYEDIEHRSPLVVDGDIRSWNSPHGEVLDFELDEDPIESERKFN